MRKGHVFVLLIAVGLLQVAPIHSADAKSKRRVLFLTKSSGYEHQVIHRDGDRLSLTERIVMGLGARNGFEVVCTKDASLINAKNLKNYDTVMAYTTDDLTQKGTDGFPAMTEKGRDDLLAWVKAGGGFYGCHTITDTFHNYRPFTEMVGGEFMTHGKQQYTTINVVDPAFPAMVGLPIQFRMKDEYYINKNVNLLKNMHVLLLLDTKGMEGDKYKIPPYPITWCSDYGEGRVFICSLGHRADVWEMPMFQGMVVKALEWTFGDVPGDASPNYEKYIK